MDDPNWDELELREIITYAPPGGVLRAANYPWLAYARIVARGGDGGAASDGTPGQPGTTDMRVLSREDLPDVVTVTVGYGGSGGGGRGRRWWDRRRTERSSIDGGAGSGGQRGQDGFVLIELWARKEADRD